MVSVALIRRALAVAVMVLLALNLYDPTAAVAPAPARVPPRARRRPDLGGGGGAPPREARLRGGGDGLAPLVDDGTRAAAEDSALVRAHAEAALRGGGGAADTGVVSEHANASAALWRDLDRTETANRRETAEDRAHFDKLVARRAWQAAPPHLLETDEWTREKADKARLYKDAIVRRIAAEAARKRQLRLRRPAAPDLTA